MKRFPLFIILFAVYPSLTLLTWNLREIDASLIVRPLFFSLGSTLLLCGILSLLIRNQTKVMLITAVLVIFFFSLGHLAILVEGLNLGLHLESTSGWINIAPSLITLLAIFLLCRSILKSEKDLSQAYPILNTISAFLVLSSGFMLVNNLIAQRSSEVDRSNKIAQPPQGGPDVYYIILDAYGRQDSLQSLAYDNSAFIRELEDIGFYVASCGRSNYPQTVLSLASSLNMGYLWEVIPNQGSNDRNSEGVYAGILHSQVRRKFEDRGYQIVALDSGVNWLNWRDTDRYVAPPAEQFFSAQLDPFEYMFLDTTALHPLMTQPFFLRNKYVYNYDRILFTLDQLPNIARTESPKFVYVHMLIPHRPNIFLPDGSMNLNTDYYKKGVGEGISRQYDIEGYINNTKFINSRLPNVIREIIQNSETEPVIIIQGDHGYQLPDIRFDILNAYFFPNQDYAALYPEITPVNTFRVIFNTYFAENHSLLKDQAINVGINRPFGRKTMKPSPCP